MSSTEQKTSITDEEIYADCKEFLRKWIEEDKPYSQENPISACCVVCYHLAQEVAKLTQQQQSAGTVFGSIIEQNKSFLNNIANKIFIICIKNV